MMVVAMSQTGEKGALIMKLRHPTIPRSCLVSSAQLVDLVNEHKRVAGGSGLEALHHLPGHGANIGPPGGGEPGGRGARLVTPCTVIAGYQPSPQLANAVLSRPQAPTCAP